MEIVRLISVGTSSSVTAHSTYLSGASVIFHLTAGIAVAADAFAVRCLDVAVRDPFAANVAAVRGMNLRALAARADQQLFVHAFRQVERKGVPVAALAAVAKGTVIRNQLVPADCEGFLMLLRKAADGFSDAHVLLP